MTISETSIPEFDQEIANTRPLLDLVPEDKYDWKPHEKSMTMGRLASHIADLPNWAVFTINQDKLDLKPEHKPFLASTKSELLAHFDASTAAARQAINNASAAHLAETWSLVFGGKTIFSMPRATVLRTMVMNHLIHHRAQLGVYLRLNDVPIPGMYGPSADSKPMF